MNIQDQLDQIGTQREEEKKTKNSFSGLTSHFRIFEMTNYGIFIFMQLIGGHGMMSHYPLDSIKNIIIKYKSEIVVSKSALAYTKLLYSMKWTGKQDQTSQSNKEVNESQYLQPYKHVSSLLWQRFMLAAIKTISNEKDTFIIIIWCYICKDIYIVWSHKLELLTALVCMIIFVILLYYLLA